MDNPINSRPLVLRSKRLTVEIARPGDVYYGTRFDWTGFITQVTLDGTHTFCIPESLQEGVGSGGIGLCNEFGIDKPLGYAEAAPGKTFPKLGVGLLRRPDDQDYSFGRPYEIDRLFPITIRAAADSLTFTIEPLDCRGYAALMQKTLTVQDNQLEIAYRLKNVGSRAIETNEYCHNFVAIDRQPIGPDYRLRFPYPLAVEKAAPAYQKMLPAAVRRLSPPALTDWLASTRLNPNASPYVFDGDSVRFRCSPQQGLYFRPIHFSRSDQAQWELRLLSSQVGLREVDDFAPLRVAVWGAAHVLSAEIFIDLALESGDVKTWTRRYEFFDGS